MYFTTVKILEDSRHPGLQDGVSCTSDGEETRGWSNRGMPSWILRQDSAPIGGTVGVFQSYYRYTTSVSMWRKEARWSFYAAGSFHAFQLLPFLEGTPTWVAMQAPLKRPSVERHTLYSSPWPLCLAPLLKERKHCWNLSYPNGEKCLIKDDWYKNFLNIGNFF